MNFELSFTLENAGFRIFISRLDLAVISKEFKTLLNLMNILKENDKCLDGLTYTTSKNQVRKISKTCIANIKEFLAEENQLS